MTTIPEVRDQLIVGLYDRSVHERLLGETDISQSK